MTYCSKQPDRSKGGETRRAQDAGVGADLTIPTTWSTTGVSRTPRRRQQNNSRQEVRVPPRRLSREGAANGVHNGRECAEQLDISGCAGVAVARHAQVHHAIVHAGPARLRLAEPFVANVRLRGVDV